MRVGFLGLGRMGRRMAANLAADGHDLAVFNRTPARAEAWVDEHGGALAPTPGSAVRSADVVVSMLADESSVREVYAGDGGVCGALRPGTVVVDMGTTGPDGVAWLATAVSEAGGVLVDAPVSGSTEAAQSGTLTILAGGPTEAVETVRPLLEALGSRVYHLGDTGTGAAMKLAVNAVIFALGQALSEALVLAERAGIPRQLAYDVFEHSAVAAPMVSYRRDVFLHPDDTEPTFAMTLAEKDLRLIAAFADTLGSPMPQAEANLAVASEAVQAGFGDDDMAAVAEYLRTRKGTST